MGLTLISFLPSSFAEGNSAFLAFSENSEKKDVKVRFESKKNDSHANNGSDS